MKLCDVVLSGRSTKVVCYLLSPLELLPAVSCAGQCQPKTAAGAIWVIAEISQWQCCLFISETLPWDNLTKLLEMGKSTVCGLCATSVPSLKSCLPSHQHCIEIALGEPLLTCKVDYIPKKPSGENQAMRIMLINLPLLLLMSAGQFSPPGQSQFRHSLSFV